jgi:hypothetical protein
MYGRCISSECSSSSTLDDMDLNNPVLRSSSMARFGYQRIPHSLTEPRSQNGCEGRLTFQVQGDITQRRSVRFETTEGDAIDVSVVRWSEQEHAVAKAISRDTGDMSRIPYGAARQARLVEW